MPVWCLSNDVGRWSQKLRAQLGIEGRLAGAIISGDVGIRKPDAGIYEALIEASGCPASDLYFVDDRATNVAAAERLGIQTELFSTATRFSNARRWLKRVAN